MSSSYVRKAVREFLKKHEDSTDPKMAFHDTVNREPDVEDDPYWVTVEFYTTSQDELNYCRENEEAGIVQLIFNGPPGRGDEKIIQAAEQMTDLFVQGFNDGKLEFSRSGLVDDAVINGFYTYSVHLEYQLWP